jgi:hypothetical protein
MVSVATSSFRTQYRQFRNESRQSHHFCPQHRGHRLNVQEIVLTIEEIFLSINESIVDVRWVISNVIKVLDDPASILVVLGAPISSRGSTAMVKILLVNHAASA